MSETEAVEAYVHARQVLVDIQPCVLEYQTYGPAKCRVHEGGTRFPHNTNPWCDKGSREGRLRQALASLVDNLRLEVKMGS